MIFNTFAYFALFLVPAAILFRLVRPALRPWVCLSFGAGFFVFFSLTQVGGVAGACCLALFIWESIFSRFYKKGSVLCLVGIAQTLLFLVIFKYWNFLTGLLFGPIGRNPLAWTGAFLPLGISFFTFEFIHYAVDRYRGTTPAGKFREYFAFILFFPTMVAGPIKRYQDFLPKLLEPSLAWQADWEQGVTRILAGLAKKFVIADFLTAFTNHLNKHDIAQAQRWVLPIWLLAYGMKIYADFSAYSDIAIGSARLFGIRVPENFDWPYLRVNIAEFWRHWHISLYRWLVDYVFIPLGGSRRSQPRVYLNVLITMFLSGLWHGAGLNFIVWGLWHGMLLSGHRLWSNWRRERKAVLPLAKEAAHPNPVSLASNPGFESIPIAAASPIDLKFQISDLKSQAHPSGCSPLQDQPIRARDGVGTSLLKVETPCQGVRKLEQHECCSPEASHLPTGLPDHPQTFSGTAHNGNGAVSLSRNHGRQARVPPNGGDAGSTLPDSPAPLPSRLLSWALTFVLVNLGWAFFCMDLSTALYFFRRLFLG